MLLTDLVDTSKQVTDTRSRLEKVGRLSACLRRLGLDEITIGVAYLTGDLPQGRIGLGSAALRAARTEGTASSPTLTLADVDEAFGRIARTKGAGSAAERIATLGELLDRATHDERAFLSRLVLGELRQGALEGVMADAVARAAEIPTPAVRRALMLAGDLSTVANAALTGGAAALERFSVQIMQPIQPMLAATADNIGDALERLGRAAFEFKLDGARVQVHKLGDEVRVFTRQLNDVTAAVPEIVEAVSELPAQQLILDGEAIATRADGAPYPFQTTMRRFGRKLDVDAMRARLPLTALFFDCLHLDGEDLIERPGGERVEALSGALSSDLLIPRTVTDDAEVASTFNADALARGHEGVMAKALDAAYEAGRRGSGWLKVKQVFSLDLVVLAAEWGSGRRRGWLSNLHLGARNPTDDSFVMLGKTFKGLTDALLKWQTDKLLELEVSRDAYTVYVRPELVVEIAFNEIQASPQYPAGMALRFARVKRYRPDKSANDADTVEAVRAIHTRQLDRQVES